MGGLFLLENLAENSLDTEVKPRLEREDIHKI